MTLDPALDAARELRDELQLEVVRARSERLVLRSLDGPRIQARVDERAAFAEKADGLQRRLRLAQARAARELDLNDGSAAALARAMPEAGRLLCELLAQIRALAATLSELSELNQALAERALVCTRAYQRALSPRPQAYGRSGALAEAPALAAVSRRA